MKFRIMAVLVDGGPFNQKINDQLIAGFVQSFVLPKSVDSCFQILAKIDFLLEQQTKFILTLTMRFLGMTKLPLLPIRKLPEVSSNGQVS